MDDFEEKFVVAPVRASATGSKQYSQTNRRNSILEKHAEIVWVLTRDNKRIPFRGQTTAKKILAMTTGEYLRHVDSRKLFVGENKLPAGTYKVNERHEPNKIATWMRECVTDQDVEYVFSEISMSGLSLALQEASHNNDYFCAHGTALAQAVSLLDQHCKLLLTNARESSLRTIMNLKLVHCGALTKASGRLPLEELTVAKIHQLTRQVHNDLTDPEVFAEFKCALSLRFGISMQ